jgi:uroporphyrinogen-III synthase
MNAGAHKPILITRATNDAEKLEFELRKMGVETIKAPLISIEPIHHTIDKNNKFDAVIFTSRNGVEFSSLMPLPVFCVNDSTAAAARDKGFESVFSAHGNVHNLTDLIASSNFKNLLYVRGEHTSAPLAQTLNNNGFHVTESIVYRAVAARTLDQAVIDMLRKHQIGALTFFSRRTADIFVTLAMKYDLLSDIKNTVCFGISENVLGPIRPYMQDKTYAADTPDMGSFLNLIRKLYF